MRGEVRAARLREMRGLTQQQVADRMNVSQPRVAAIESGELPKAEVGTVARYIAALGGKALARAWARVTPNGGGPAPSSSSRRRISRRCSRFRLRRSTSVTSSSRALTALPTNGSPPPALLPRLRHWTTGPGSLTVHEGGCWCRVGGVRVGTAARSQSNPCLGFRFAGALMAKHRL
ncbi:helix-turn-helix domain-containing protein [Micromonospora sp. NPDC048830]|uniref:helix-turn-helix domain-containing protein n=1 Tax=Micromonospora sp. NPDC048830 TaxID=3364257 RepID=UPI003723E4FC